MEKIINKILMDYVLKSLIVILVSFVIYKLVVFISKKNIERISKKNKLNNKTKTYVRLFGNLIKYLYLILICIILLQVNGIDVSAIVAGLGIAGIVGGFALQDMLKDIIMGSNIITDNFFVLGDVVKYNDIEGKVIYLGLKATKIQDIYTNNVITITNRNIDKITKVSNWLDINIPISYNDKVNNIEKTIIEVVDKIRKIDNIKNCEYLGLNEFKDSSILYKLRIYCSPECKPKLNREALRIIKTTFEDNNIVIPFNQLDIHNIK